MRADPRMFVLLFVPSMVSCSSDTQPIEKPPVAHAASLPALAAAPKPVPPKRLFARKFVSRVRGAPNNDAPQLGYLRAGAVLTARTGEPVGFDRCRRGWYEIAETGGFVCDGREVTAFEAGAALPDRQPTPAARESALPYRYAFNRGQGTPMYKRLPSEPEALVWEDGVVLSDAGVPVEPLEPPADAGAAIQRVATLDELQGERGALVRRRLNRGFHVSLDRDFDTGKRRYWRTMSNGYIPFSRMQLIEGSSFHGIAQPQLPLAFVARTKGVAKQRENDKGRLVPAGELAYHVSFPVTGERSIKSHPYLVTPQGELVRSADVTVIAAAARPPAIAPTERWLDLDLSHQTLVAYEGDTPVYATLVSTGRFRSENNPQLNTETPAGRYRILSKHVSATMDGDHAVFGAYSLEDVPYVQFFKGAFALHGAFWHDRFGRPASHGCINLAPEDARWLFDWSGPSVPRSWHGGYPRGDDRGTWLIVHGETPRG